MFYREITGDVVSQVYEVSANSWEEAKKVAWDMMDEGDTLVECGEDALVEQYGGEYRYIDYEKAKHSAVLQCGVWIIGTSGKDDWREDVWYWTDDPEKLLNADGSPYEG